MTGRKGLPADLGTLTARELEQALIIATREGKESDTRWIKREHARRGMKLSRDKG